MRSILDKYLSWLGLALAVLLAITSGLLFWASSFASNNVHEQLSAQKITMPSGKQIEDPAIKPYLEPYAGQEMTNGDQAKAFADHYIKVHMDKMGGGKTYEEVSGEFMKKVKDPTADKAQVAKLGELRQSLFMGNTLRGMLLNAYAFSIMGKIAQYAAWAAGLGALLMLGLSLFGLRRAKAAAAHEGTYAASGTGTTHGATRA